MKILAIVIARPTESAEEFDLDYYLNDEKGDSLYIDCLWCAPGGFRLAALGVLKQFGTPLNLFWHRWKGGKSLRQAKAEKLLSLLLSHA